MYMNEKQRDPTRYTYNEMTEKFEWVVPGKVYNKKGKPVTLAVIAKRVPRKQERNRIGRDPLQRKVTEVFEVDAPRLEQVEWAKAAAMAAATAIKAQEEPVWTPAAGSAAAAAAADSAPTLGPVPVERKKCPCGRLINVRFDKCFNCNAKEKQLKASADADSDKLLESLKREVADKQRELAKLQLKEADQAFERTQQAVDAGSYGEDSQSD